MYDSYFFCYPLFADLQILDSKLKVYLEAAVVALLPEALAALCHRFGDLVWA